MDKDRLSGSWLVENYYAGLGKRDRVMKRPIAFVLLIFMITPACVRVQIEVPQAIPQSEKRMPPEGKRGVPDEILERDPYSNLPVNPSGRRDMEAALTEGGEANTCPGYSSETPAIAQEWGVWCWAASSQAIMSFHKVGRPQCEIVNKARAGDEMHGDKPYCCDSTKVFEAKCQQNGRPDLVFEAFGIDYRWYETPFTPRQIAGEICAYGPFSYLIGFEQGGGHTFVVKDYRMDNGEMLLLMDQHDYYTDETGMRIPAGFKERPYEFYKEAWYENMPHRFGYNYFKVKPQ